jgi:hypothetical protein
MNARAIHLLVGACCTASLSANADTLYKCVDSSGQVLYTNQKDAGTKCAVLSRDQAVSSVPPVRPLAKPPADFPRIDSEVQKSRDTDRRKILQQELATEQQHLEKAKTSLAEQESPRSGDDKNPQRVVERLQPYKDAVALHERNIEALNRELSNLK